jgi:DNA (cytosine-5)-methyltransferase 1
MTVGSLFAGIGGFDLAAERVGWEVKWQVEIDPFCRRVLEKHWPDVRRYQDVRRVHGGPIRGIFFNGLCYGCSDCVAPVDVLCGGFPCQDISYAGDGLGIGGPRSGLWKEYKRLVGELRPRYVVVENVAALLDRGMGVVLGDLAALGYDAEWSVVSACAVGAPHTRERVWIVAYPTGYRLEGVLRQAAPQAPHDLPLEALDAWHRAGDPFCDWPELLAGSCVRRVADGVAKRVDRPKHRIKAVGNTIVPQIAEWIFRQIQAAEEGTT